MPRFGYSNTLTGIKRIDYSTTPPVYPYRRGRTYWDTLDYTLAVMQNDTTDDVINQVGQETTVFVRNDTGTDWPNGSVVYPVGSVGQRPNAALAQANSILTARARGMTTQAIPKNSNGFVTVFGIVRGVDTSAWNEGDFLYLSNTVAGGLQNTPPTAGFCVICGYVLFKSAGSGIIFFSPYPVPAFGNLAGGNYTHFEFDGTMKAVGLATCYRDELQSVTGAQIDSPAGDFERSISEASVVAKITARYPTDYITANWQLNHDWAIGTSIYPHIHWWQTTANTPNWVIASRWQKQGAEKTTAWTNARWVANATPWGGGFTALNQITGFGAIAAPVGYGQVSDIVQIRLYRDYTDVSGLFLGVGDPVNASQSIVNLDTHIQIDTLGSRQEYIK